MVLSLRYPEEAPKGNRKGSFWKEEFLRFIDVLNMCGVSNLAHDHAGGIYTYYYCQEGRPKRKGKPKKGDKDHGVYKDNEDGIGNTKPPCKGIVRLHQPEKSKNPDRMWYINKVDACTAEACRIRNSHVVEDYIDDEIQGIRNDKLFRCSLNEVIKKVLLHIIKVRNVPIVGYLVDHSPSYRSSDQRVFLQENERSNHFLYCEMMNGKYFQLTILRYGEKQADWEKSSTYTDQMYILKGLPPIPTIPLEPGHCEFDRQSVGELDGETTCHLCGFTSPLRDLFVMNCVCQRPAGTFHYTCIRRWFDAIPYSRFPKAFTYDPEFEYRECNICRSHASKCSKAQCSSHYVYDRPIKGCTTYIYHRPVDKVVDYFLEHYEYTADKVRAALKEYAANQIGSIVKDLNTYRIMLEDYTSRQTVQHLQRHHLVKMNDRNFVDQLITSLLHEEGEESISVLDRYKNILEDTLPDWARYSDADLPENFYHDILEIVKSIGDDYVVADEGDEEEGEEGREEEDDSDDSDESHDRNDSDSDYSPNELDEYNGGRRGRGRRGRGGRGGRGRGRRRQI